MKKIYILLSATLISASSFAQFSKSNKLVVTGTKNFSHPHSASRMNAIDTTGIVNFTDFLPEYNPSGGSNLNLGYLGGGYIYGNNSDGLDACAQGYQNVNATPVKITGVLAVFVGKKSINGATGGANSVVTVKAWNIADNKANNTNGANPPAPALNSPGPATSLNAPIASASLAYADIDTTDFTYIPFATPPSVSGDFAIGVDFNTLVAGDTAGLLSSPLNSAGNLDFAFHNIANGWYVTDLLFSTSGSGDIDNNIALWAILANATGVDEYFNGMKLTTYPNPTVDKATIEYTLENASKDVAITVFDKSGRKVLVQNYDNQAAGTYKVDINASVLSSGTYFYQLIANGHSFAKQFVVTK